MVSAILHTFFLLLLLWIYQKKRVTSIDKKWFAAGVLLKVGFGLLFGSLFFYHFENGDTIVYFKASGKWADLFYDNTSLYFEKFFLSSESYSGFFVKQHRAVYFTKIFSVFLILTQGSYWLSTIYFSVISFFSSWFFYSMLCRLKPENKLGWWIGLFAFPGLLFWGGGIVKETVTISSLFFLSGLLLGYMTGDKSYVPLKIILALLSLLILIKLKYYIAAVFLPGYLILFYLEILKKKKLEFLGEAVSKKVIPIALVLVIVLFIMNLSPNFYPGELMARIVSDHDILLAKTQEKNRINYDDLSPGYYSFFVNAPNAFVSGMFRPFVWEGNSFFQVVAGTQNLIILILFLISVYLSISNRLKITTLGVVIFVYCLITACFLAYSTPNFGTLERFKIHYQPFLILMMINIIQQSISSRKKLT